MKRWFILFGSLVALVTASEACSSKISPVVIDFLAPPLSGTGGTAGMGGAGGEGGEDGEGGTGGIGQGAGGTGGSAPAIAAHTVLSGSPTTDGDGCLVAQGASAHLVFEEQLDTAKTIQLEVTTLPDPDATGGPEGVGLYHVCIGGNIGTTSVLDCHRVRVEHNTYDLANSLFAIVDGTFNPLQELYWTPASVDPHNLVQTISVDPDQGTISASCSANGTDIGSVAANGLPPPAGDAISIFFSHAKLCSFRFIQ